MSCGCAINSRSIFYPCRTKKHKCKPSPTQEITFKAFWGVPTSEIIIDLSVPFDPLGGVSFQPPPTNILPTPCGTPDPQFSNCVFPVVGLSHAGDGVPTVDPWAIEPLANHVFRLTFVCDFEGTICFSFDCQDSICPPQGVHAPLPPNLGWEPIMSMRGGRTIWAGRSAARSPMGRGGSPAAYNPHRERAPTISDIASPRRSTKAVATRVLWPAEAAELRRPKHKGFLLRASMRQSPSTPSPRVVMQRGSGWSAAIFTIAQIAPLASGALLMLPLPDPDEGRPVRKFFKRLVRWRPRWRRGRAMLIGLIVLALAGVASAALAMTTGH